jgi:hypothetical protein
MPEAPDWYFDIAAQVDMATWARDRVVLVGDAALYPSTFFSTIELNTRSVTGQIATQIPNRSA